MPDPIFPEVTISARAAARLRAGHLWVYTSDASSDSGAQPGSLAYVVDPRKERLGTALYSSSSQIKLRLLTRDQLKSEEQFLQLVRERIAAALDYRKMVVKDSDTCRIVFSEGDLLPGLVIDRYNDIYTLQVLTQAWDRPERKTTVFKALQELAHAENIAERTDERIRELESLPALKNGMLLGAKNATVVTMNGVRFQYDALSGQKTGAFLDQRENYAAAAGYARGTALDVCTYQGGFALHLARVCEHVTALDISREALEIAEQNEKLNASVHKNEIEWIEANAFDLLKDYANAGRQYDVIVLDPPAFARTKRNLPAALRGYKELNLRALKMLRPGGTLVTCSCSFHMDEPEFMQMLTAAAQDARRYITVMESRAQAKDHPILLGVPETHYLKCVIASVR